MSLTGCGAPVGPIGDDAYVEIMSRLAHVHAQFIDPTRADSARRAVLAEAGIAPQDLVGFAEMFGGDPEKMLRLHERIRARVDSLDALDREAPPAVGENPTESGDHR